MRGTGKGKGKGKVQIITDHEGPEREYRYSSTLPLISATDGDEWSTPIRGRFNSWNYPVSIV